MRALRPSEIGRPIGVLADLPGPKIRAGQFPEGGVPLVAGSYVKVRPGDHMSSRRSDLGSTTRPCSTTSRRRPPDHRRRRDQPRVVIVGADEAAALIETGGRTAGPSRSAPAVRADAAGDADRRGPRARRTDGRCRGRVHRRLVRASRRRHAQGARRGRRPGADRRQDRDHHGARQPERDPRRVRRDHGRPWRPRDRLSARGRAAPAEVDHPPMRRVRRAGDHRHPDAGVDGDGARRRPGPR